MFKGHLISVICNQKDASFGEVNKFLSALDKRPSFVIYIETDFFNINMKFGEVLKKY